MDALSYSLAYYDDFDNLSVTDVVMARHEFFDFYESRNFSSLLQYYRAITNDPTTHDDIPSLIHVPGSFFLCTGCEHNNFTTHFVNFGMCYTIYLSPSFPVSGDPFNRKQAAIALEDRTRTLFSISQRWLVHACPHFNVLNPKCRSVTVKSPYQNKIQVSVSEFTTIDTASNPCQTESDPEYPTDQCWAWCQSQHHRRTVGCEMFWLSLAPEGAQNLTDFCNYFEPTPGNRTLTQYFAAAEETLGDPDEIKCFENCEYPCKKISYHMTLDAQYHLQDSDQWGLREVIKKRPNLSLVFLEVSHSAVLDGGVTVWTEVNTYYLSQFISNIGGALGLFVGGTVMTLAQIIMFFVHRCLDRKVKT